MSSRGIENYYFLLIKKLTPIFTKMPIIAPTGKLNIPKTIASKEFIGNFNANSIGIEDKHTKYAIKYTMYRTTATNILNS